MKREEMWIGWTRDGLRRYEPPEDADTTKKLVVDMTAVSTAYADSMLKQFEKRFGKDVEEEEEENEEDEDEDEDDEEDGK